MISRHFKTLRNLARGMSAFALFAVCSAAPVDDRVVDAAKRQDWEAVRLLLASHADVRAAQDDGATALHWAAQWDDPETAGLLIQAGADPNAANVLMVTPLALACLNGSSTMVAKLLTGGARPGTGTASGETPLMTCARTGSAEAVRLLLENGADVNAKENTHDQTALMWAAAERHSDVVRILLQHGADVHVRSRITKQVIVKDDSGVRLVCPPPPGITARCVDAPEIETGGSTPLLFAARSGDTESTRLLLAAGASVTEAMPGGESVLVVAALSGHTQTAKFLLDKDAPPNAAEAGYTALHAAVLRGDRELTAVLLAHAANPNARVTNGMAVRRSSQDFVIPDSLLGATPFFLAAKFVEPEIMRLLASAGADAKQPIRDGTTPLMAAAGVGWKSGETRRGMAFAMTPPPDDDKAIEAVRICVEQGADVTAANEAGETALHGAATEGYAAIIKFLIDREPLWMRGPGAEQTPLALTSADLLGANGAYGVRDRKEVRALLLSLGAIEDPARAAAPAAAAPKNLKVLKDAAQVRSVMAGFTAALGVQCAFCHAQDRASDENPHKETARRMLLMTAGINAKFPGPAERVSCYTCHRGQTSPLNAPAAVAIQ